MKYLTEKQIVDYAKWVYNECDDPISEIEWLVQQILDTKNNKTEIIKDFTESVNLNNN
jgi:hypothetical protein